MNPKWRLAHARGYLELGLVEEAAADLAALPAEWSGRAEVLGLRACILQEQERWPELAAVAADLVRHAPGEAGGWVTWAYATRRAVSLEAAEAILREAELRHPREPTIQFNLGCYACLRGDLAEARRRVAHACHLEADFRHLAASDPDLRDLREKDPEWQ